MPRLLVEIRYLLLSIIIMTTADMVKKVINFKFFVTVSVCPMTGASINVHEYFTNFFMCEPHPLS